MAYLHKVDAYEKDHVFSQEELAALTPNDIKRWMCVKAYGTPEPGMDANPTECRSTSIAFWKKAISSFMPNRLMQWNALSNVGNPTKSSEVNDLIKAVKEKEVRKASSGRRPLQHDEFQAVNDRERMQEIYSQMTAIRGAQEAQTRILERLEIQRAREHREILADLRRIAGQPIVQNVAPEEEAEQGAGNNNAGTVFAATLSANPRSLHVLWEEYERGIGGRRAARLFTSDERGKVKHKYHRRKMVWDLISTLVRGGLTAQGAIDRIYDHYGRADSVTTIITKMKNDRRNGTVFPL
jgi:hypothetical protein